VPNEIRHQGSLAELQRPGWLPEAVWPFDTFTFDVDGSAVAFTDVGKGSVLLFVHVGLWSFVWRDLLLRLSRRYRCICLDAPGNGQSAASRGEVFLEESTRAVAALIEYLELKEVTLVVHDLGGPAGIVGAARSSAKVVGLVAINAFAWRPGGKALRIMLRVIGSGAVRELDVLTGAIPRITATRFGVGRHLDAASRLAFLAGIGRKEIRAFHNYLADALRCESLYTEASVALKGRFAGLPLLTIFGERNDPFHFQQEWARWFPAATQLVIPGGNHFPMCDDPAFVAEAIDVRVRGQFSRSPARSDRRAAV
jgi:pimeloyl-ACP methyl ester carboxylesterase